MKRKGFTLIELLAVIVVLAIIALIATPIVMNTIEKSKKGAAERSAEEYVHAVNTSIMEAKTSNNKIADGEYYVCDDGNLYDKACTDTSRSKKLEVSVNGTKPDSGSKVVIQNGEVVSSYNSKTTSIGYNSGKYTVTINDSGKATASDTPAQSYICEKNGTESQTVGAEYICTLGGTEYTFYVLEDGDITTLTNETGRQAQAGQVSLIMDRNIGDTVAWISLNDFQEKNPTRYQELKNDGGVCENVGICIENTSGPITANAYLASQTSSWEVTATLPSKEQIEGAYSGTMPTWLYDYLNETTHPVSGVSGYWTSSASADRSNDAWLVYYGGSVYINFVYITSNFGLRPVITISKSLLN